MQTLLCLVAAALFVATLCAGAQEHGLFGGSVQLPEGARRIAALPTRLHDLMQRRTLLQSRGGYYGAYYGGYGYGYGS